MVHSVLPPDSVSAAAHHALHTVDLTDEQIDFLALVITANSSRLARWLRSEFGSELTEENTAALWERIRIGSIILGKLPTRIPFTRSQQDELLREIIRQ